MILPEQPPEFRARPRSAALPLLVALSVGLLAVLPSSAGAAAATTTTGTRLSGPANPTTRTASTITPATGTRAPAATTGIGARTSPSRGAAAGAGTVAGTGAATFAPGGASAPARPPTAPAPTPASRLPTLSLGTGSPFTRALATPRARHHQHGLSALAIVLIALGGMLAAGLAAWAAIRRRARDPHWWLAMRHAFAEAGFRTSETWAEFSDWARLGR